MVWRGWLPQQSRSGCRCGPGTVGGAHLFIAALALAVLTCGIVTVTRRNLTLAVTVVTLCGIGGLVAAVRMWQPVRAAARNVHLDRTFVPLGYRADDRVVGSTCSATALCSVTGRDVFHRGEGMPVDAVALGRRRRRS